MAIDTTERRIDERLFALSIAEFLFDVSLKKNIIFLSNTIPIKLETFVSSNYYFYPQFCFNSFFFFFQFEITNGIRNLLKIQFIKAYLSQFNPVTVQRATGCRRARRKPCRTHQVPAIGQEPVVKISNMRHTAASTAPKCINNKVLAVCCCCVCGHRSRYTRLTC